MSGEVYLTLKRIFLCLLLSATASAQETLCPQPIHRSLLIEATATGTASRVEEYCSGSRVIAHRAHQTSIADYARGEITMIDRRAGTWSVVKFADLASAAEPDKKSDKAERWDVLATAGSEAVGNAVRPVRKVRMAARGASELRSIDLAGDETIRVSRGAAAALLGIAFPSHSHSHDEAVLDALRTGEAVYALPLLQTMRFEVAGEAVEIRIRTVAVDRATAPREVTEVPSGARLVIHPRTSFPSMLRGLDLLPAAPTEAE